MTTIPSPSPDGKLSLLLFELSNTDKQTITSSIDGERVALVPLDRTADLGTLATQTIKAAFVDISTTAGLDFAAALNQLAAHHAAPHSLEIIGICDEITAQCKEKAFAAGVTSYMIRPLHAAEIAAKIEAILHAQRLAIMLEGQKTAREALKIREGRYSQLVKNLPNSAVIMFDTDKRFLLVDGTELARFGFSKANFEGKTIFETGLPAEFISAAAHNMDRVLSGESFTDTIKYLDQYHLYYYTPIQDEEWIIQGGLILAQNVTNQKNVETALKFSEEKFSQAFYHSPDSITLSNPKSMGFVDVNGGFEHLTGYTKEEAVGQSGANLELWVEPAKRLAMLDQVMREGFIREHEFELRTKHGEIRTCLLSISSIEVEEQSLMVGVARDITEQRQGEQLLKRNSQSLAVINKITTTIHLALDSQSVADLAVKAIIEELEADFCSFFVTDDANQRLVLLKSAGDGSPLQDAFMIPYAQENIFSQLLRDRESKIWRGDVDAENVNEPLVAEMEKLGLQGAVALPIIHLSSLMGVLLIGTTRSQLFDKTSLKTLNTVAGTIGLALANAQTVEALKTRESQLSDAQELSKLGSWTWDLQSHVITWTDTIYDIFQVQRGTPLTFGDYGSRVHPADAPEIQRQIEEAIAGDAEQFYLEHRIIRDNGETGFMWVRANINRDKDGVAYGMFGTAQDMTTNWEAEESQRGYINRLQFLYDLDRAIEGAEHPKKIAQTVVNPLRDLFDCYHVSIADYDPDAGVLQTLAAAADPQVDLSQLPPSVKIDQQAVEVLLMLEEQLTVDLSTTPIIDDTGKFLLSQGLKAFIIYALVDDGVLLGTLNLGLSDATAMNSEQLDIARQVSTQLVIALRQAKLYEQLQQYTVELEKRVEYRTRELEAKTRELEAFNYSISHDLRAPLRAIDAFSKAVVEQHAYEMSDKGRLFLSRVRFNAKRMGELIDDLLKLSRLGRKELQTEQIDLNEMVHDIVRSFQQDNQVGDAKIQINPLPPAVGDPSLIRQVWVNLISNALKYSKGKPDPVVMIGYQNDEVQPHFFVRDNGIGFDMQYYDHLFGVFERLVSNEAFEGTGIGLAIVKRIINRHNGEVWAEGAVNEGATFSFSLNCKPISKLEN